MPPPLYTKCHRFKKFNFDYRIQHEQTKRTINDRTLGLNHKLTSKHMVAVPIGIPTTTTMVAILKT